MGWSYTGDPLSSPIDAIRFLIGDTDSTEPQLQDEEIAFLVTTWRNKGTMYWAASQAAETIAAKYTREIALSSDSQTLDLSQLSQKYMTLAEQLRSKHWQLLAGGNVDVGGITPGQQPDPSVLPTAFGRGMHDNYQAGEQDFGDWDAFEPLFYYPEVWGTWGL